MNKQQGARIFFGLLLELTASVTLNIPAKAIPEPDATVSGGAPSELECQAMTTPLGLGNAHPRLSWRLHDPRRGAVQIAYEIRVASSSEKLQRNGPDVWDCFRPKIGLRAGSHKTCRLSGATMHPIRNGSGVLTKELCQRHPSGSVIFV